MGGKKFAFVGKMHSGKSTISKLMIAHRAGAYRLAFADPVKEASGIMLADLQSYVERQYGGPTMVPRPAYSIDDMNERKGHPAIRGLLQLVGTELGRNYIGPDTIWIDMLVKRVKEIEGQAGMMRYEYLIVNDDCRFPNEAERLREIGFKIIRLERNDVLRQRSIVQMIYQQNPELEPAPLDSDWIKTDKIVKSSKLLEKILTHPSETEQENIKADATIFASTVEELQEAIPSILDETIFTRPKT